MGINQWEWDGMGILIVFPHTSTVYVHGGYSGVYNRRKMTDDDIGSLINLRRCEPALSDSSVEIMQFHVET